MSWLFSGIHSHTALPSSQMLRTWWDWTHAVQFQLADGSDVAHIYARAFWHFLYDWFRVSFWQKFDNFLPVLRYSWPQTQTVVASLWLLWAGLISMGHACWGTVRLDMKRMYLCLKRPNFYCLIHFYKRCVSSLALMGRSPWVYSGWVSILSVKTIFIKG